MTENLDSLNEENVDVDTTENVDTVDSDDTAEEVSEETDADKLAKLEDTNKKLFARAKKAETELKASKDSSTVAKPVTKEDDILKVVDQRVSEALEEKDLDAIKLSDAAKLSLKAYAKAEDLTIKKAMKSDYFSFLKDKEEAANKVEEASIGGKRGALSVKDFDIDNPPKVDMETEEGQKAWEEYNAWAKNHYKK